MSTGLDHRLVASYLRDLDLALLSLPLATARELSEQLRAHLLDALPPEVDDATATEVLAALGSPAQVAAAARLAGEAGQTRRRPPLQRRMRAAARRVPWGVWLSFAAIALTIGVPGGTLLYWNAQASVAVSAGAFGWWSQVDGRHDVTTTAAGVTQDTIPIRPGKIQGFVMTIVNPSDLTIRILRTPVTGFPGGGVVIRPQVGISVNDAARSGLFRSFSYRSGGIIPPHGVRALRLLWRPAACFGGENFAGEYEGFNTLTLWVKIGWITRTEVIPLPTEVAVADTAATVRNCWTSVHFPSHPDRARIAPRGRTQ